jgi:peptidoglycan/xylan/chitin deacetylase (PgdA/CDA1 family)
MHPRGEAARSTDADVGAAFVPVLLYHAVTTTPGDHIAPFAVRPDEFERQLDAVLDAGFTAVSFGDLLREELDPPTAPRSSVDNNGRRVVITFDDGYADFAEHALPALQVRGLPSTLFLTTGWLAGGKSRAPGPTDPMLSWSQLPELLECGVELGAHSHSHPHMDTLRAAALRDELVRCKEQLEDALGRRVDNFAYPHGYNGPRVRRATRATGYRAAAAVRNALHPLGEDPFGVSRLTVLRTTRVQEVAGWIEGADVGIAGTGEALATRGWRAYRRGRALLRGAPGSDYR